MICDTSHKFASILKIALAMSRIEDKLCEFMRSTSPTSCYFTAEEKRRIQEIAECEERPQAKIVQFAVRAFSALYKSDPDRARELAKAKK